MALQTKAGATAAYSPNETSEEDLPSPLVVLFTKFVWFAGSGSSQKSSGGINPATRVLMQLIGNCYAHKIKYVGTYVPTP